MVKRIYFFKDGFFFEYDPRPATDRVVKGPIATATRLKGLTPAFARAIQAAVNWGDGFIYFFKGDEYWKYDALLDRADTTTPRKIKDGWPTLPPHFAAGIDAAFNSGTGKAYFFKGPEYLRYDINNDRVDTPDPGTSPYPRAISDPDGWRHLNADFQNGIDAAVNAGDGKLYFFKGKQYVRLTYSSRSADILDPPYPRDIQPAWDVLPARIDAAVEWIHAGAATLNITVDPAGCSKVPGRAPLVILSHHFDMTAAFAATGYPSLCGCAEYRQFVRGTFSAGGVPLSVDLLGPGGVPTALLPRPLPGAASDNFLEDFLGEDSSTYGRRHDPFDPTDIYEQPDARAGCRYRGEDTPEMHNVPGAKVEMDLDFRGLIVDVCAGDEVLAEVGWRIHCTGVL